jgi:hypothetical protein
MDISTRTTPVEIGYFDVYESANSVCMVGQDIYLARGMVGMDILHCSDVVDVTIARFDATPTDAGIRLDWTISADEPIAELRLLRRTGTEANLTISGGGALSPDATSFIDTRVEPGRAYSYTLEVIRTDGFVVTSQIETATAASAGLSMEQNYPNPFNPSTTITFTLPERASVELSVYTTDGKLVTTIVDGVMDAGYRKVEWDGTNSRGVPVSSGVYFYRLEAGKQVLTRKMLLLK